MNKLLFVLLLLPLLSKSQDKVLFIELENEKFEIANRDFYISKVIDERIEKDIIGVSQKGMFNKKIDTKFKDGLEVTLDNFIQNSMPKEQGQRAVLIKIRELQISELTEVMSETGTAWVKMDFFAYNDSNQLVKVFQTGSKAENTISYDVTKYHEKRIRHIIVDCLEKFSTSIWMDYLTTPLVNRQEMELFISDDLTRGLYKNFEEFLSNKPSITDGYYIKSKPRKHVKWNKTNSYLIKHSDSKKNINNIWGFSNGDSAFILHQQEYYPIVLAENSYRFVGYDKINSAFAVGFYGGGLIAGASQLIELNKAKNKPTTYSIDLFTGFPTKEPINILNTIVKLYVYRGRKNEQSSSLAFLVDDSLKYTFVPNSYLALSYKLKESPIKVCYGPNLDLCVEVELNEEEDTYVKCTFLSTEEIPLVHKVKTTKGEFEVFTPKKVQKKRDKQKLKNKYSD